MRNYSLYDTQGRNRPGAYLREDMFQECVRILLIMYFTGLNSGIRVRMLKLIIGEK